MLFVIELPETPVQNELEAVIVPTLRVPPVQTKELVWLATLPGWRVPVITSVPPPSDIVLAPEGVLAVPPMVVLPLICIRPPVMLTVLITLEPFVVAGDAPSWSEVPVNVPPICVIELVAPVLVRALPTKTVVKVEVPALVTELLPLLAPMVNALPLSVAPESTFRMLFPGALEPTINVPPMPIVPPPTATMLLPAASAPYPITNVEEFVKNPLFVSKLYMVAAAEPSPPPTENPPELVKFPLLLTIFVLPPPPSVNEEVLPLAFPLLKLPVFVTALNADIVGVYPTIMPHCDEPCKNVPVLNIIFVEFAPP